MYLAELEAGWLTCAGTNPGGVTTTASRGLPASDGSKKRSSICGEMTAVVSLGEPVGGETGFVKGGPISAVGGGSTVPGGGLFAGSVVALASAGAGGDGGAGSAVRRGGNATRVAVATEA